MQKILIVSATPFEIEPLLRVFNAVMPAKPGVIGNFKHKDLQVDIIITGVGMSNTAFAMGTLKSCNYDLAINAGVCGSFNKTILIGDVVNVKTDCFSELGAQSADSFLSLTDLGLGSELAFNENMFSHNFISKLKTVKAITVNTVHGNVKSIDDIKERLNPDIESMEGAAFFQACNTFKWPALQLRAVSNKVEQRNKDKWNMPLAIENLNKFLIQFLDSLS
jgi:futalosine hydrolase